MSKPNEPKELQSILIAATITMIEETKSFGLNKPDIRIECKSNNKMYVLTFQAFDKDECVTIETLSKAADNYGLAESSSPSDWEFIAKHFLAGAKFMETKMFQISNRWDETLLAFYKWGWNDCANNNEEKVFANAIFQNAYNIGRGDFIAGDDVSSVDLQTVEQILSRIKRTAD